MGSGGKPIAPQMPDDDTGSVRGRSSSSRFALPKEPLYQLDKDCNVTQGPYGLYMEGGGQIP